MYAALRQVKAKPGTADQLAEQIKGAAPTLSAISGFMGYYVIYACDDTVTAISIFNKVEEAEGSNRLALAWAAENLAPFFVGPATATAGPARALGTIAENRLRAAPAASGIIIFSRFALLRWSGDDCDGADMARRRW
jgi:hypothetical protein